MSRRSCARSTIRDEGGWWRSTNTGKGVYFIYCGGLTAADRFYLDLHEAVTAAAAAPQPSTRSISLSSSSTRQGFFKNTVCAESAPASSVMSE